MPNDIAHSVPHKPIPGQLFWESHFDQFHATSLTRKAYCHQHGLAYSHFQYWYRKLHVNNIAKRQTNKPQAIPVVVNDTALKGPLLSVEISNNRYLHIYDQMVLANILAWLS